MAEVILIASGKGGTGKTTVTAALACALADEGRRVAAVDCDFGLRNLDIALGLAEQVVFDVGDVLSGRVETERALLRHPEFRGLALLPSTAATEPFDPARFDALMDELSLGFDYVLLDAPAGIGSGLRAVAPAAERAFLVTTPDTPCLRDSAAAADVLAEARVSDVRLILNRVDRRRLKRKTSWSVDAAMDELGLRLFGLVREDPAVSDAFSAGIPLMRTGCRAAADAAEIAARLCGKRVSNARWVGYY